MDNAETHPVVTSCALLTLQELRDNIPGPCVVEMEQVQGVWALSEAGTLNTVLVANASADSGIEEDFVTSIYTQSVPLQIFLDSRGDIDLAALWRYDRADGIGAVYQNLQRSLASY